MEEVAPSSVTYTNTQDSQTQAVGDHPNNNNIDSLFTHSRATSTTLGPTEASILRLPPLSSYLSPSDNSRYLLDSRIPSWQASRTTAEITFSAMYAPDAEAPEPYFSRANHGASKFRFERNLDSFEGPHKSLHYWRMSLNGLSKLPGFGLRGNAMQPPVVNTRLDAYTHDMKSSFRAP